MSFNKRGGRFQEGDFDPEVNRDHEGLQTVPFVALSPAQRYPPALGNYPQHVSPPGSSTAQNAPFFKEYDGTTAYGSAQSDGHVIVREERRVLGLTVVVFWAIIIVLVLVITGGLGAGIGIGLSRKSSSTDDKAVSSSTNSATAVQATSTGSSTSTAAFFTGTGTSSVASSETSTSTSKISSSASSTSAVSTSLASPIITSPCDTNPAANSSILTARDSAGAAQSTFTLLCNTNYPAGATYGNPGIVDLLRLSLPSMAACIDACSLYNDGYAVKTNNGDKCMGVSVVKQSGDYCWLKNAAGVNDTNSSGIGVSIDSAILIQ